MFKGLSSLAPAGAGFVGSLGGQLGSAPLRASPWFPDRFPDWASACSGGPERVAGHCVNAEKDSDGSARRLD